MVRVFVWNLRTSLLISLFWWYFSWYVGAKGLEVGVDVVASISQRDTPDFEFVGRLTASSNVNTWRPLRSVTVKGVVGEFSNLLFYGGLFIQHGVDVFFELRSEFCRNGFVVIAVVGFLYRGFVDSRV